MYTVDTSADEPIMLINSHIGFDPEDGMGVDGAQFQRELLELDSMGKKRIQVWINSPGGNVMDGYNIFSAICDSKTPVDTYAKGVVASIASCGASKMATPCRCMEHEEREWSEGWAVVDKGSNNGTFVSGQRVTKYTLKHGERVVMGKHSLIYDAHSSAQSAAADKKKAAGMGGEMTMFVDQQALAKAMASNDPSQKRMAISVEQGGRQVAVPLLRDETTMGSAGGADIPAKGFLVKGIQAKVVKAAGGHHLISLGGWRAVKVNGHKVSDALLKPGDVIAIAGSLFTYKQA